MMALFSQFSSFKPHQLEEERAEEIRSIQSAHEVRRRNAAIEQELLARRSGS